MRIIEIFIDMEISEKDSSFIIINWLFFQPKLIKHFHLAQVPKNTEVSFFMTFDSWTRAHNVRTEVHNDLAIANYIYYDLNDKNWI